MIPPPRPRSQTTNFIISYKNPRFSPQIPVAIPCETMTQIMHNAAQAKANSPPQDDARDHPVLVVIIARPATDEELIAIRQRPREVRV